MLLHFLLTLAAEADFIAGVVGWLDFEDAAFAAKLDALLRREKFVGLRPMLQDLPDDDYLLRPTVLTNLRHLAEMGAACVASTGRNFFSGSAATMTVFPVVPDYEKYPDYGRDLSLYALDDYSRTKHVMHNHSR